MSRKNALKIAAVSLALGALGIGAYFAVKADTSSQNTAHTTIVASKNTSQEQTSVAPKDPNPLKDKRLFLDTESRHAKIAAQYKSLGENEKYELIKEIADRPTALWLIGPNASDPDANRDFIELRRTSGAAKKAGTVPLYQLYAIPKRDACATYSNGGFSTDTQYLSWLDKILAELQAEAIFTVEADAVAHTLLTNCLSEQQKNTRLQLLDQVMSRLANSPKVIGAYLDAGHSEWFPDPSVLTDGLKKAGVLKGNGVAVNVSSFVSTDKMLPWVNSLLATLGNEKMGAVIDTSRNGRGTSEPGITGEARWCNPTGRGLGYTPSTSTGVKNIHAYLWVKVPGESDGSCFGYPAAGSFVPEIAFELARNSLD